MNRQSLLQKKWSRAFQAMRRVHNTIACPSVSRDMPNDGSMTEDLEDFAAPLPTKRSVSTYSMTSEPYAEYSNRNEAAF